MNSGNVYVCNYNNEKEGLYFEKRGKDVRGGRKNKGEIEIM